MLGPQKFYNILDPEDAKDWVVVNWNPVATVTLVVVTAPLMTVVLVGMIMKLLNSLLIV